MNILVTGGAGFIGTRLCEKLLELGHSVINYDMLTYAANVKRAEELQQFPHYILCVGNTCNAVYLRTCLETYRCDAVMHLAAESHVDRSISGPQSFIEANVLGTYGVLEAIRAYLPSAPPDFRFLHVSTDEVFGDLPLNKAFVFNEESHYNPSSPYSASKASADHLVRAWGRTYGIPYLITYGVNAYGPGQLPDKLVPMCIENGLRGKPITIHGTGNNVRSWLHVDDHVDGLLAVLAHGKNGEAYCLEAGEQESNLGIVDRICKLIDDLAPHTYPSGALVQFIPDRPGNDKCYAIDSQKIRATIGWTTHRKLEEGLRETVIWHINQRWRLNDR